MAKKTFLLCILSLSAGIPANAGTDFNEGEPVYASRWRDYRRSSYLGLRFGLNVPTVRYKGTGGKAQTGPLPRFHVGLVYGNKLGDGLPIFLESGLIYTEKGTEIEATEEYEFKKCYMRYLEFPIVLKYKAATNIDDLTVQPFFGCFMATGLGGTTKNYESRTKTDTFGKSRYKRFDAGLRVGCGMAFQNFYLEMGYDIGLFNIAGRDYGEYDYDDFDGHIRTGNLTMTLGVDF